MKDTITYPKCNTNLTFVSQSTKRLFHLHFNRAAPASRFPLSPIFSAGQYGYHCHRVPAVVKTSNGHILVFVESRRDSCGDQTPKAINMRRYCLAAVANFTSTLAHNCLNSFMISHVH